MTRTLSPGTRLLISQALTFAWVGVGTLVLDYTTYRGLLLVGTPLTLAKVCGFVVGTTAAYLINRTVTFGHRGGRRAVISFLVLYSVTLVLNVGVNALMLHLLAGVSGAITLAFLVAQAVTSAANFFGLRHGVFRMDPRDPDHAEESGADLAGSPPRPRLGLTRPAQDPAERRPLT